MTAPTASPSAVLRHDADLTRYLPSWTVESRIEGLRLDIADAMTNPGEWAFPAESIAVMTDLLASYERERDRRQALRHHPMVLAWPDRAGSIKEIKEKIDLACYIEREAAVDFHRSGKRLKARCPFRDHLDDTPSFVVTPATARYRCFGCGRSGDVVDFTSEWLGVDVRTALRLLRQEAGLSPAGSGSETGTGRGRARVGSVRVG